MTWVKMIHSVGEHVAGTKVNLTAEVADTFIVKGYAEGVLSREYDEEERQALQANDQTVQA